MFDRFRQRMQGRTSHVVCVFVESNDSTVSDHCVIGPMSLDVANEVATIITNSVSRVFGERLNEVRYHVDVVPRKVLREEEGAEWLIDTIANTFERESPSRLQSVRSALQRHPEWVQYMESRFPWLNTVNGDGVVFDSTPWSRPDIAQWLTDKNDIPTSESDEDND